MTDTAQRELIEAATRALAALDEIDPDRAARLRVALEDRKIRVHSEGGRIRLWVDNELLVDNVGDLTPEQWIKLQARLIAAVAELPPGEQTQVIAAYEDPDGGVQVSAAEEVYGSEYADRLVVDVGHPGQEPELRLLVGLDELEGDS